MDPSSASPDTPTPQGGRHTVLREIDSSPEAQAAGLSYDITITRQGAIELHRIDVEPEHRWNGVATRFMDLLTRTADSHNLPVELEVGSGTDDENIIDDLPRFYAKWGFNFLDGYMRRNPMESTAEAQQVGEYHTPKRSTGPSA